MERLVVTGMGAVTPLGIGVENYWNGIVSGKCGIAEIPDWNLDVKIAAMCKDFDPIDFMPKRKSQEMSRIIQLAYAAAEEAIEMSGLADDVLFIFKKLEIILWSEVKTFGHLPNKVKIYME